ncbi:MAG: Rieske 2Fe-2S domain-containing protein [Pseudomonadota bacterium]|nr:Rieske 2Fe-2S domain-containing protein [Pseudomonadota bacterium]
MLSHADNEMLVRTGPGTPMGQLFRSFWLPVALLAEVAEPDAPPKRLKIMGEDLLLFRQSDGKLGLVEPRCPHRGADLYWGRNEECGLRCVYHGWKFGADGRCLDIPNMQPGRVRDTMMKTVRIRSLPVAEMGGAVWAWFGDPDAAPPLPVVEWALVPDESRYVSKKLQECNWAQAYEGAIDTAHFTFVHRVLSAADGSKLIYADDRTRWIDEDGAPYYEVLEHPAGLTLGGARRGNPGETYWRISQTLLPSHATAPGTMPGEPYAVQTWVPVDDENCWIFTVTYCVDRPLSQAEHERYAGGRSVHAMVDDDYVPLRNRANNYLVDRAAQKDRSFTGVTGLSEQDAMVQDSQGRIVDRTREILTPSDEGVVRWRKMILALAREVAAGKPPAVAQNPEAFCVHGGGAIAPEGQKLEQVMRERFGHPTGLATDMLPGFKAAE